MNILIVNWRDMKHPQAGGAERYLYEQAKRWRAAGHTIDWICGRAPGLAAREEWEGIRYHRAGGSLGVYPCAWWQYLRLPQRPDVIIDAENGIPFFTPLLARARVVLLIFHIHTDVWNRECSPVVARIGRWLEESLMPRVYGKHPIVTISASSEKEVRDLFPTNPVHLVYSAVDEAYQPGPTSDTPELLYVGRLKRYKSIDVLLRAMAILDRPDCALHIIGQGDDAPRLEQLSRELGLTRVHFHGFVTEAEKIERLQRAWLFVNPSSMEGWGITNIEANACGTPVLGADVPGIRDSVREGESGWLIPHGDPARWAEHLADRLADRSRLLAMQPTCLRWAQAFSWDASAETFLTLLEAEAGDRGPSGRPVTG